MANPVVYFEIIGKDANRLYDFYGDNFGWTLPTGDGPVNYRHVEGATLPGGIGEEPDGDSRVTVYVQVPDLQAALDRAGHLGATTLLPLSDVGNVSIALFSDPAGNVVGLLQG
ncbi:MAG TPA: VOC family protein [Thermomicrobiales bacterium]|nr:VOC family protein [Thermomicrobiales bacterium]